MVELPRENSGKELSHRQEKALRDYNWAIQSSKEEGKIEGKIEGKKEGEVKGKIEGEIKLIHTLQAILLVPQTPEDELSRLTLEQLQGLTAELQAKAMDR